jgi:hypothetical protein
VSRAGTGLLEVLGGRQQQPADLEQRVVLAAPVPEGLLLDAMADIIDRSVGELAHVEVVQHQGGVVHPDLGIGQRRAAGRRGVERGELDPRPPGRALGGQPVTQHLAGAALADVQRPATGRQVHCGGTAAIRPRRRPPERS